MSEVPRSFSEFWPHYLRQHADPRCRGLHYVGSLTGLACVLAAPLNPWLIPVGLGIAYGLAWIGHFGFERNRPASWYSAKHFYWSFISDWKMIGMKFSGRLRGELAKAGVVATDVRTRSPAPRS